MNRSVATPITKEEKRTTPRQLSLAMFADLLPLDRPISEAPTDIGFRRNRVFLDIRDLSIASHRAMDATFFSVAQDPDVQPLYDLDLSYFKWLMMYTSNNRKHLRAIFRDLQKSALEAEAVGPDAENWGSIPLLGPVAIRGGRLLFEMDPRLQKLIKDPAQWQFLSLRVSTVFTSNYARVLYDHLLEYCDDGITEWLDLDTVRRWTDAATKAFNEFKYLKRTVLDPAVKQINEVSNLEVGYTTSNIPGSKKIDKVRFTVRSKPDAVNLRNSMLGSKELYDTLRDEFGLSPKNFDEIMENREGWTDDWIHQAIEFTRFNIARCKVTKSVSGFLMNALRNNLKVGTAELQVAAQMAQLESSENSKTSKAKKADQAVEDIKAATVAKAAEKVSAEVKAGLNAYDNMEEEDRAELLQEFKNTHMAKLTAKKEKIDLPALTEIVLRSNILLAQVFGQFMYEKVRRRSATAKEN